MCSPSSAGVITFMCSSEAYIQFLSKVDISANSSVVFKPTLDLKVGMYEDLKV